MKNHLLTSFFAASLLGGGISTSVMASEPKVHLYNWFGLIAPETPKEFTKETGISLVIDSFDSADVMQSKVMAGRTGYDVVVATSNVLPSLIKSGALQKLNRSGLSNWSHLDPKILEKLQPNDPGNRYAVPYLWGTTGIGYDVQKIDAALGKAAPVDSWDLVFKEENISKLKQCGVAMLDSPTEIVSIALHYLGLPHNSHNPQDYEKAQSLLLSIRPYVRYFDSSRLAQDLANGNTCIIVGWAGDVTEAQDASERAGNGRQLAYSIPREGTLMWSENLVLLNDAPHPVQGLELINYLLRSEIITKTTNHTGYPSGSINAKFHFDEKRRDNPGINPSPETIATLFPLEPLPLNLERLRTRVWSKVKSGI